jgi:hypothetical protein
MFTEYLLSNPKVSNNFVNLPNKKDKKKRQLSKIEENVIEKLGTSDKNPSSNKSIINACIVYLNIEEQDGLEKDLDQRITEASGLAGRIASLYGSLPNQINQEKKEILYREEEKKLIQIEKSIDSTLVQFQERRELLERAIKSFEKTIIDLDTYWDQIHKRQKETSDALGWLRSYMDIKKLSDHSETEEKMSPMLKNMLDLMMEIDALKDQVFVMNTSLSKISKNDSHYQFKQILNQNINTETAKHLYKDQLTSINLLNERMVNIKPKLDKQIEELEKLIKKKEGQLTIVSGVIGKNSLIETINQLNREILLLQTAWKKILHRKGEIESFLEKRKNEFKLYSNIEDCVPDPELIELPTEELKQVKDLLQRLVQLKERIKVENDVIYSSPKLYSANENKLAKHIFVLNNQKYQELETEIKQKIQKKCELEKKLKDQLNQHKIQIREIEQKYKNIQEHMKNAKLKLEQCKEIVEPTKHFNYFTIPLIPNWWLGSSPAESKKNALEEVKNI